MIDSSAQLRDVMGSAFSPKKLMSVQEFYVFRDAEEEVRCFRGGFRVFAQTSLGEVIESRDRKAHSAINSKRVDVLIVSRQGYPVIAIEYQGGGHYQGQAAARDAVKKEALRRAGVDYIEIGERHTPAERRALIRNALAKIEPKDENSHRLAS